MLQGKNYKNVILSQGDANNLPFKENIFDCVCNTFLIDRFPDVKEIICKSIEVLKKGGLLIFTDLLNFNTAENRNKNMNAEKIVKIVQNCGIEITNWHDGLLFKQKKIYEKIILISQH